MALPLYSLAYVSRNAIGGTPMEFRAHVQQILDASRGKNATYDVTGALLFSEGCFAQVLEGPREGVERLYESIRRDTRHSNVEIVEGIDIEQRSFAQWSMAFGGIDAVWVDTTIYADSLTAADEILATSAGQKLLTQLRRFLHRDDLARRDALLDG